MYDLETLVTDLLKANGSNPSPLAETAKEILEEELFTHWNSIHSGTGELGKWEVTSDGPLGYQEGDVTENYRADLTLHDGTVIAIRWVTMENSWSNCENVESVTGPFYRGPSGRLQEEPVTIDDYFDHYNELLEQREKLSEKIALVEAQIETMSKGQRKTRRI